MLTKLFSKIEKQISAIKQRSEREIIEEIHNTFYTEVDRLLEEARISKSVAVDEVAIDKANRLKYLGFSKSKDTYKGMSQLMIQEEEKRGNKKKKDLIDAIDYFSFKYPMYKFITEESVKRICEKYGLIYGPVTRYIGEVPTKNLKDIERFSIHKEDRAWVIERFGLTSRFRDIELASFDVAKIHSGSRSRYGFHKSYQSPLEIAAPVNDFDTSGMEMKNFKLSPIQIPDPVVLMPVLRNGSKYYLIVTAWGLEASDPDVMNEKMN